MNNEYPNIQVLKASKTGIFTNYIYKAIPLAFDESMSYYECLCGLLNYLKNVIIPTVNNNADAVVELQNLYNELHDYVEHYFDNLDVQEEINNKLDDMAESGELADIIAQYLGLAGMITFDTVADMKLAENLVNGSKCATLGYHSVNDNGNAFYKIRTITNEDVVDEASIIALHDNQLVAELITQDYITPEMFGCYGDNTHDDTNNFLKALNYGKEIRGNKTYLINCGGTLYDGGKTTEYILLNGGTYNISGRLNYSNDIMINNCTINGNLHATAVSFTGKKVVIKNSKFDVGELAFRLNNTDFESVLIENNYVRFYGSFWMSAQTEEGHSQGNVYIKNNEFYGKTVETQSESYYCSCVVENDMVEFSGNYCHDFIINDTTQSVHDGYFSSNYVYHHDNTIKNLSGGDWENNALIKAKSGNYIYYHHNNYEITSDTVFPILQVQNALSEWHIDNCNFNIKNSKSASITDDEHIYITNCKFNVTNVNGANLLTNCYHMNNCEFNITNLNHTSIVSLSSGIIQNTKFNVTNVDASITSYGCVYGYSNENGMLDNVSSNINLVYYQFRGPIKNCTLNTYNNVVFGELINCKCNTRILKIYDVTSPSIRYFNVSIIDNGKIYGKSYDSTDTFTETIQENTTNIMTIKHDTANSNSVITLFTVPNDKTRSVPINITH